VETEKRKLETTQDAMEQKLQLRQIKLSEESHRYICCKFFLLFNYIQSQSGDTVHISDFIQTLLKVPTLHL
jgi:hypothetical protein